MAVDTTNERHSLIVQALIGQAHARMNAINGADPRTVAADDGLRPRELVMSEHLEAWVRRLNPDPSVPLLLASRSQHLARWTIPRTSYPAGRLGYLQWRKALCQMHADLTTEILREVGFDEPTIQAVREINLKRGLRSNPDTQLMEDALCLTFLEQEWADFAAKHEDEKALAVLRKTWRKMSARGQQLAHDVPLSGRAAELLRQALA